MSAQPLHSRDLQLLNRYQHDFPLVPEPYKAIGEPLGMSEAEVLERLTRLRGAGVVSRVGAVLQSHRVGASTLAAMDVPLADMERIAAEVNAFPNVNHNYEREHALNLWFVVTAASQEELTRVIDEISRRCGLPVYIMPMVKDYHIDLGFPIHGAGKRPHE